MKSVVMTILVLVAVGYVGFGGLLYLGQRSLLYLPTPEVEGADGEAIEIASGTDTIRVWKAGTGQPALIYFGGNAESVSRNLPVFRDRFADYTHYLVNYRGYGGSSGKPTEAALYEDALATYDHVAARHDRIAVIGRSLGGAVAVYLATRRPVDRLALVTPFDSVVNMARHLYPLFPVRWFLKDRFDALALAGAIDSPVLVVAAGNDRVVPYGRTESLVLAMDQSRVKLEVIADAGHNDIDHFPEYDRALRRFINSDRPR